MWRVLPSLTNGDLKVMGVVAASDRFKLPNMIANLTSGAQETNGVSVVTTRQDEMLAEYTTS